MFEESFFTEADKHLPYHNKPEKGKIIGLTGFAQSGKDTVGKILIEKYNFKRLSFADALRDALLKLNPIVRLSYQQYKQGFWEWISGEPSRIETKIERVQDLVYSLGWDVAKTQYPEIRELLQRLGTEAGREIHGQDCWTNIIKREILSNPNQNYVITDVRFPNEKELIEKLYGLVVRVSREGVQAVNNHISDKPLDGVKVIIRNDSNLQDLEATVNGFAEDLFNNFSFHNEEGLDIVYQP